MRRVSDSRHVWVNCTTIRGATERCRWFPTESKRRQKRDDPDDVDSCKVGRDGL